MAPVNSASGSNMDWLGNLIQSAAGTYGAQNAAEGQQHSIQDAINYQQGIQNTIGGRYAPQTNVGNGAFNALSGVLGLGGQKPDESVFTNMPGYQFAVNQGTQAIQRAASANGSAYTPNTLASIGQYVTGTAAQDYNTYVNQLLQTAGFGNQANAGVSQADLTTGGNIAQLDQNKGQAGASGVAGTAGALSGTVGALFGNGGPLAGSGNAIANGIGNWFKGGSGGANASGVVPNTGDANGLNPDNANTNYSSPLYTWDQGGGNADNGTTYWGPSDSGF